MTYDENKRFVLWIIFVKWFKWSENNHYSNDLNSRQNNISAQMESQSAEEKLSNFTEQEAAGWHGREMFKFCPEEKKDSF